MSIENLVPDLNLISYFTMRENGFLEIQTVDELIIDQGVLSELHKQELINLFLEEERFDFDNWYFIKNRVISWNVLDTGTVIIISEGGTVEISIPSNVVEEARELLSIELS